MLEEEVRGYVESEGGCVAYLCVMSPTGGGVGSGCCRNKHVDAGECSSGGGRRVQSRRSSHALHAQSSVYALYMHGQCSRLGVGSAAFAIMRL